MRTEDSAVPPFRSAGARDREELVVERLRNLSTALDDEPSADFRAATRARLVAMAAVRSPEPAPEGLAGRLLRARASDGPRSRWRTRVTAGLAGAALAVSALGTLVALSADAQPGDLLYPLKRGTEQTQLALAGDDRALTLLEFASTRLDELAATPEDPELVVQTLATMDEQTAEGTALLVGSALGSGSAAPVDRLAAWSEEQSTALAELQPALPAATTGAAQASLELLDAVDARVAAVQAALGCAALPPSRGSDDLGPIPGVCEVVAPPSAAPAPPADPAGPPAGEQPPAPSAPSAAPSGPPAPPAGTGSGTGSGGGAPSTAPRPPAPSLPLPLPGPGGTTPTVPSLPTATTTPGLPPPLIDLPLPCILGLLCDR
ncbi:DUF5667 domain-containing protein [Blastococcus sp. TF02A-26]|uniref:DUF5667 domain-containing protein n=1 Tax=Blastococcus sp. TF02A-26 TaxID=2250577 RepID=UPI000DEBB699|nr:DUF5667 domain-containing protein [Blastococcus sp. TF02A-26]RBY82329.1 hypothetical protein DQ240_18890 [Blastococcus sp. TF02A-26]